jgi:hypothetical protein
MWPQIAAYFGVEAQRFSGSPRPLREQVHGIEAVWSQIAATHGLDEMDLSRIASWWHTDADLGHNLDVLAEMGESRMAGFHVYSRTDDAFRHLFDRYRSEIIIP